jgi:hypothetical protein
LRLAALLVVADRAIERVRQAGGMHEVAAAVADEHARDLQLPAP